MTSAADDQKPSGRHATYEPNGALRWLYRRFFSHLTVDEKWSDAVRDASKRGVVVYVMRSLSVLDFLCLERRPIDGPFVPFQHAPAKATTSSTVQARLPTTVMLLVLSTLTGCDGGVPGHAPDAGAGAIALPAPPVLTPCPAGWREVVGADGLATCDPWPETGYRADCAWDEAHFPGTLGCARVGTACPADGWPAELPTERAIVYVDDDAAPGGDGMSHASAFSSIEAAALAAPAGAVIAVAVGRYDEVVRLGPRMTLWGACVSGTRIVTSAGAENEAALEFIAAGAGARNLSVDSPARLGVLVRGARLVSLEAVIVVGARVSGVFLNGGSMTARDVVVRSAREAVSDGTSGRGIDVELGAHLTLTRAVVDDNRDTGIIVTDAGSSLEASDIVVRGTRAEAVNGATGRGIAIQLGAHLALTRSSIDDNRETGILIGSPGTTVEASDVVVRGTRERVSDGTRGRGVGVLLGAQLALSRALVDDNREQGIYVTDVNSSVMVRDVVVRGTRERTSDGALGWGIGVYGGAQSALTRTLVEDNREIGISVSSAGTIVEASDLVARGTRERVSDGTRGRGIDVENGARLALARALVDDNRDVGIFLSGAGALVEAAELTVRDTGPIAADGSNGVGIWAQRGSRLLVARAGIQRSGWVGIAGVTEASVDVSDVVVSDVEPTRCPVERCVGDTGGFGLVAMFGGSLAATRFTVEGATLCGVMVGEHDVTPTGLDLTSGVIDRSAIGACVQEPGFDVARLQSGVEYRDVGVPLRATSYELPSDQPVAPSPSP